MIHTSCAVVAAPTLDRALANGCLTVECDRPSRWTAALSRRRRPARALGWEPRRLVGRPRDGRGSARPTASVGGRRWDPGERCCSCLASRSWQGARRSRAQRPPRPAAAPSASAAPSAGTLQPGEAVRPPRQAGRRRRAGTCWSPTWAPRNKSGPSSTSRASQRPTPPYRPRRPTRAPTPSTRHPAHRERAGGPARERHGARSFDADPLLGPGGGAGSVRRRLDRPAGEQAPRRRHPSTPTPRLRRWPGASSLGKTWPTWPRRGRSRTPTRSTRGSPPTSESCGRAACRSRAQGSACAARPWCGRRRDRPHSRDPRRAGRPYGDTARAFRGPWR